MDALKIAWRQGRPHLACPYSNHADDTPSWRWDEKRARAYCTCTKGDSVLDVMAKVEGIDFEAAKIRAAEILARHDLIHEDDGARHQATDARSLLDAPAECRNDALPLAYLAHRLGVAPGAVPRPSTPTAGLKARIETAIDAAPKRTGRGGDLRRYASNEHLDEMID